jgi:hypothetical protein
MVELLIADPQLHSCGSREAFGRSLKMAAPSFLQQTVRLQS